MNFLAIGPNCWGKAETRKEAVRLAKQNFPASGYVAHNKRVMDKHFSIYTSEGTFMVDDMGRVSSTVDDITQIQKSILAN